MILFDSITYINFLSTGAAGNTIYLNKHNSTLISAKNGSGKSTILDAIIFALFGKPFRDINKNQLINSINGKGCMVKIDFQVDSHTYTVVRGIKPAIFEILQDGVLIDQEAAIRDYQKFLETQILKTNVKAFTQSVILGTANFTPFMQMKPGERRDVIEDFLDVKIFGVMNQILKGEISDTKAELYTVDSKFTIVKTKVDAQKKLIDKLEEANAAAEVQIREKIQELNENISEYEFLASAEEEAITTLKSELASKTGLGDEIKALEEAIHTCKHTNKNAAKTIKFFESNDECPSCQQGISADHKKPIVKKLASEYVSTDENAKVLAAELATKEAELQEAFAIEDTMIAKVTNVKSLNTQIVTCKKTIIQLEGDILALNTNDILDEKIKLKDLATEAVSAIEARSKLSEHREIQDIAYDILKDSGVKTTIIREYLPVINQLINKYLAIMDFYVDFNLDEAFNEVIRSRGRDEFTYASFSEGEKKRLDIAILFAWRHVAKLKNSVNCNILFLDEILESGLDEGGLDAVFQIIEDESKFSNVFVISHADRFKDKFDVVINIEKVGDFSVVQ